MSYLEILAYISVGLITFSWILVFVIDIGKKYLVKKIDKLNGSEKSESENE